MTDAIVTAPATAKPDGDVTLSIAGSEVSGWEEVEVTLRAEGFPNSFTVGLSTQSAVQAAGVAGTACRVLIGNDLVVSGYIDRVTTGGSPTSHSIQIIGRGKTQDLVDCSAEWPSGQLINGDALEIATKLAEPYGLQVELGNGAAAGPKLPGWLLNYGETGAEIVQRVARNAGLLAYEDARGVLILGKVGTDKAASGIVYGGNVQDWSCESGVDQRYSDYVCSLMPSNAAIDITGPGDIFYHHETDPNVPRHRQLDFVLETVASDTAPGEFTAKRAQWEATRRAGRSEVVRATVDSWRDGSGKLWAPNTIVPVSLPDNRAGGSLVIAEVSFQRSNDRGTTATLVLMPAQAFTPEPIALQPVPAELKGPGQ